MLEWSSEQVVEWLKEMEMDSATVKALAENSIDGKQLYYCTEEELGKVNLSKGRCMRVVEERDEYLSEETTRKLATSSYYYKEGGGEGGVQMMEAFRKFNSPVEITDKYRHKAQFAESAARPTTLIDPVRKYVHYDTIDTRGDSTVLLARELVQFSAACLNDRTNGVFYVGVKDGVIQGVHLEGLSCCEGFEKCLLQYLKGAFCEDQLDCVLRCIRPIKCIEVVPRGEVKRFVLEIDVVPRYELCENDLFWIKAPKVVHCGSKRVILHDNISLYKFGEKEPEVEQNVQKFLNIHSKIVKSRKTKEAQSVQKKRISFSPELKKQFVNAICQGESTLKGDRYHMLVVTPVDDAIDEEYIKENLSFIKDINWRVVLDFGSDGSICKYMQSEEFRVRHAEEFDSLVKGKQEKSLTSAQVEK